MHLLLYIYLKVVSDNFNTVIFMGLFLSSAFLFFLLFSFSVFSPGMFGVFLSHPGHSISFTDVKIIIQPAGYVKTTVWLMGKQAVVCLPLL